MSAPASAATTAAGESSGVADPALVPNVGQSDAQVRYEARGAGGTLFFTAREVVLARPPAAVRLRFLGSSRSPTLAPVGRRAGVVNHALGNGRDRWGMGLPRFGGVVYRDLYPGIDVRHDVRADGSGPWMSSAFTVAGDADARRLRWRFEGAERVSIDGSTGGLRIAPATGGAAVTQPAPVAWQERGGRRVPVKVAYAIARDGSVGLELGSYDARRRLRVGVAPQARRAQAAPAQLDYSTFLGGLRWDEAYDVDVDRGGSAYVTGLTFSTDFPRKGSRRSSFRGVIDAFVARFSRNGTLVYSSYLGGERMDVGHSIAVDGRGNAYVTGRTHSGSFPTRTPLQRELRGRDCQRARCHDAFVTKLDARGAIVYSTYLGGATNEEGWGIAVDKAGSAYVTGNTDSTDFPTDNAVQDTNRSRPCRGDVPSCPLEVFVTKLDESGRRIDYSTYLGGADTDTSGDIAVDEEGRAHVTGTTRSSNFPTRNARQNAISGRACGPSPNTPCLDVFVTKLSPRGSLDYSTYHGGQQSERSGGIALDARGRAYVTGATQSQDFPTSRAIQPAIDNASCRSEPPAEELCDDAFVTGFSTTGRRLAFSTYLGGNAEDQGLGIAVDGRGAVHVAGSTDSRNFPTRSPFQAAIGGSIDAFATRLSAGGARLERSSYLGGSKNERANAIAIGRLGEAVLTGRTESPDFPTARPAQPTPAGDFDAFITRLR